MTLFPFFEDIENKTFLVVGGGEIAKNKIKKLKMFTDNIVVVAEKTDINGARLKPFDDSDVEGADFVVAATDDGRLNEHISRLCREKNIPVNAVDCPELCTFVFPALIKKGDLSVAVATNGKSPAFSKYLREQIENLLPGNAEEIIDEMYSLRKKLKKTEPDRQKRAQILKKRLYELI